MGTYDTLTSQNGKQREGYSGKKSPWPKDTDRAFRQAVRALKRQIDFTNTALSGPLTHLVKACSVYAEERSPLVAVFTLNAAVVTIVFEGRKVSRAALQECLLAIDHYSERLDPSNRYHAITRENAGRILKKLNWGLGRRGYLCMKSTLHM